MTGLGAAAAAFGAVVVCIAAGVAQLRVTEGTGSHAVVLQTVPTNLQRRENGLILEALTPAERRAVRLSRSDAIARATANPLTTSPVSEVQILRVRDGSPGSPCVCWVVVQHTGPAGVFISGPIFGGPRPRAVDGWHVHVVDAISGELRYTAVYSVVENP